MLNSKEEIKFVNLVADCVLGYLSYMKTGNRRNKDLMDMKLFDVLPKK